jgi:hypothetical protein
MMPPEFWVILFLVSLFGFVGWIILAIISAMNDLYGAAWE